MNLVNLLLYSALLFLGVFVVLSILIVHELRKRNVEINFFWLRLLIPKYANQYKKITLQETGRVGPLFYPWILSINLAAVLAIVALVTKVW
jgi:hypothetical protein